MNSSDRLPDPTFEMLIGAYPVFLAGNRVRLPARYRMIMERHHRERFAESPGQTGLPLVLRAGPDRSIVIRVMGRSGTCAQRPIDEEVQSRSARRRSDRTGRALRLKRTCVCRLDSCGRITIPRHLREYARLRRDLICIGALREIRLWARETFDEMMSQSGLTAADVGRLKDVSGP